MVVIVVKGKTKELETTRIFCLNYDSDRPRVATFYPQYPGVVLGEPRGSRYLGHVTYLKKGARVNTNRSAIDLFLIAEGIERFDYGSAPMLRNINQEAPYPGEEGIEQRHGVTYAVQRGFENFIDVMRRVASYDIWQFHIGEKHPVINSEPLVEIVDEIEGVGPRLGGWAQMDGKFGKQVFQPECVADLNLDFMNWCITGVTPFGKVYRYALIGGGSEPVLVPVIPHYRLQEQKKCNICYNGYKQTGFPMVFNATRQSLVKQIREWREIRAAHTIIDPRTGEVIPDPLPTRYLRIAKGTEAGHPITRRQLLAAFEACLEEGLSIFMPQKFLEPDEEVARRFKETNSTLLISFGDDHIEKGACAWARTNDARFRDGLWYLDKGVRAVPNVNVNALEEFGGPYYRERLFDALFNFPLVQILPSRIKRKDQAYLIGGWNNVKGKKGIDVLGEECGGCDVTKDHQRLFNYIHPSIKQLVGDNNGNVRMCHHNHSCSWCGKCFMPNETGVIKERKPVVVIKDSRNIRPRRARIKNKDPTLFNMDAAENGEYTFQPHNQPQEPSS